MFILVKYGNNETLLCNPSCMVVNLLTSIKRRSGYGNTDVIVDIADETGLVKELDNHKFDTGNKHLDSHATYILVSKELAREDTFELRAPTPLPPQYNYKPLLEKYEDLFPNFNIRSAEVQKTLKSKSRTGKSPSPAGRYSTSRQAGKKTPSGKVTTRRK
ncbi:uncharacterized protein LOC127875475 [Dreissena polymorpha]|uniref:Uncharacterized protein n=1 Tax=Dreissena polymorpha TaxID=45954 RepID=A0A9D4R511_DREPO|nr:uncharacterized protein LOC127875475 [Dreissena polymorpha]KAH3854192.1 hypothetical protein DPMN_096731 [Dreissena polymorpha]